MLKYFDIVSIFFCDKLCWMQDNFIAMPCPQLSQRAIEAK